MALLESLISDDELVEDAYATRPALPQASKAPLRILLLSDNRPGHFRLSEGIIEAVRKVRPVSVERVILHRPRWMPPKLLARLTNCQWSPEKLLKQIYGIEAKSIPECDLIVSAGGDTLAANIAIKRLQKHAANIFYGSLRGFKATDFSVVLTSNTYDTHQSNVILSLKPSSIDTTPIVSLWKTCQTPRLRRAGLIFGGDTREIEFKTNDLENLFRFIAMLNRQHGTRWTVANTPRTPQYVTQHLQRLSKDLSSGIDWFIDYQKHGAGSLTPLYATSEAVLCTGDTSTCVSEAVWARRPCIVAMPQTCTFSRSEHAYRRWLSRNNWTRDVPIEGLTPSQFADCCVEITPMSCNPFTQLTDQLQPFLTDIVPDNKQMT